MTTDKLPPHDIKAEEAVIGSLLLGGKLNGLALVPGDFYHEPLQILYTACSRLEGRGSSINQITLGQEVQAMGKLDQAGGVAYLSQLISVTPTHLDLPHYAEIVRRLALSRMMVGAGGQIATLGMEGRPDIAQAMDRADDLLLDIRRHGVSSSVVTPEDRARLLMDRYEMLFKSEGGTAIKTGLLELDYRLGGGFYRGDLTILGARPSMGKTTVMQNIANNIGKEGNVLFCSAEMGIEGVSDRDVAGVIGVPISDVRRGGYDEDTYARIVGEGLSHISDLNVFYYKDMPMTTAKIIQAALSMKLRHGLKAVFVDYLGILDDESRENQTQRLGYMARKLKMGARMVDVPFVVAHQLSRRVEERGDKRPQLYDLRESGQIEEHADAVLFLYRDSYYAEIGSEEAGSDVAEILLGKLRQGDAGRKVKVYYDRTHQKYTDLRREE